MEVDGGNVKILFVVRRKKPEEENLMTSVCKPGVFFPSTYILNTLCGQHCPVLSFFAQKINQPVFISTTSLLEPQYGSVEKHFLLIIRSLVYHTMKRTHVTSDTNICLYSE